MVSRNADSFHLQGDGSISASHLLSASSISAANLISAEQLRSHAGNTMLGLSTSGSDSTMPLQVLKSGPLLISSKGIGWTSWKKRWFILTRTSLVFFRSDPSVAPQKGSEANLTLGGIDLNSSASVVVRAEKRLLTVLFPDGREGRAFTLKAETSEDMYEWKNALEAALAQAQEQAQGQEPGATAIPEVEQSETFQSEAPDAIEGSFEQWRDNRPAKSLIVGRPVLYALEDDDGSPSFLEKALRFIEQYGVKVEGILRQSADVDEVENRVKEYEQGKNEFSPDEDAHLVADCIKHILRELPSCPVPASCCTSLLQAFRTGQGSRVNAMKDTIFKTFPEPNRRLLQRVLKMMRTVVCHKSENRMSTSAVAACMAPLLLRPLLAGDCEVENDFNMAADGSVQLLRAAAAANHAQVIVIILLEEFGNIFSDGSMSPALYSESEGTGSEYGSTDDESHETLEDDGYEDEENDVDVEDDDDVEDAQRRSFSDTSGDVGGDLHDQKQDSRDFDSDCESPEVDKNLQSEGELPKETHASPHHQNTHGEILRSLSDTHSIISTSKSCESLGDAHKLMGSMLESAGLTPSSCITSSTTQSNFPVPTPKPRTVWGRTSARKNLSMESIEFLSEDEIAVQNLESIKVDLQNQIAAEENGNQILQASLEKREQALLERRLALEQDVARLRDQLQREKDLRATLEAALRTPLGNLTIPSTVDGKTRAEIEGIAVAKVDVINLKQKVTDLHVQLDQQCQHNYYPVCKSCGQQMRAFNDQETLKAPQRDITGVRDLDMLDGSEPPQKQQLDSVGQNCTESTEETITLPPGCENVLTHELQPLLDGQSPKRQQSVLTGTAANFPTACENVEAQDLPSLSEKQPPPRQWSDSTLQNRAKFEGGNLSLSSNHENGTEQGQQSLPVKQPTKKSSKIQCASMVPKLIRTATSSSMDCGNVIGQNPPSLSHSDSTRQSANKYIGPTASASAKETSGLRLKASKSSSRRGERN